MIEILKPTENGLQILDRPTKNAWINVVNPDSREIQYLSEILKIKEIDYQEFKEDINSLQDMEEIPFMEKYKQEYFIITRTPHKLTATDPESKYLSAVEYLTLPLGIMINKDYIVTICFRNNEIIDQLKVKKFKFTKSLLLLKLLLISSKTYLKYLKEIDRKIKVIEERFEVVQKSKDIYDLLDLKKSLIYFNTSLKTDQILIEKVARNKDFVVTEDDKDLINDVIDENKQAIVTTAIYKNIITDTTDLFNSLTSNNLNKIMKLLTSITIVIAIPTMVAGIYGMNVPLPFDHHPQAFIVVMAIIMLFSFLGVFVLWKNKMF
ncbi:MAG: magnesium transporter CorA family protein [Candidatus ainarchaeum sp.]|nr:magnesium transporter CorA family protein [Candidatus ainarchaeum sp.]